MMPADPPSTPPHGDPDHVAQVLRRNWLDVRRRIDEACSRSGRPSGSVRLVAVTKLTPPAWSASLLGLGQRDLGENYPQELWRKAEALAPLGDVRWHLIGHLQSNKARRTFPLVRMIHAVDSLDLLRRLDDLAAEHPDPPAACLQVNCSGEPAKHGWEPSALLADAEAIASISHLPVVGLMTMAALGTTPDQARPAFRALARLRDDLARRIGRPLPELSMGMSGDFEAAIEEGATVVRIGSALFEGLDSP